VSPGLLAFLCPPPRVPPEYANSSALLLPCDGRLFDPRPERRQRHEPLPPRDATSFSPPPLPTLFFAQQRFPGTLIGIPRTLGTTLSPGSAGHWGGGRRVCPRLSPDAPTTVSKPPCTGYPALQRGRKVGGKGGEREREGGRRKDERAYAPPHRPPTSTSLNRHRHRRRHRNPLDPARVSVSVYCRKVSPK
jgi:hypothetical protein